MYDLLLILIQNGLNLVSGEKISFQNQVVCCELGHAGDSGALGLVNIGKHCGGFWK